MSNEPQQTTELDRTELPIERGFPIERVNEIAEKESRAGMHYRPIYTMHKWWARRLGCVFRTIALYTLLSDADADDVSVRHPATGQPATLAELDLGEYDDLQSVIDSVSQADPEPLWNLYTKDVTVEGKRVLDPFMGGGTSLVETSRFGADADGYDLNPVAWFVTKKEIEAGETDLAELEAGFEEVEERVAEELKSYYRTPCPHADGEGDENHQADAMYYFWTKELDCTACGSTVSLFNDYRIGKGRYENKGKYNVLCPDCESIVLVDDWQSDSTCSECGHEFVPKEGTAGGGDYACGECGQKYDMTEAIGEQDGFSLRLYAVEYYCPTCDKRKDMGKSDVKGYKPVEDADIELFERAQEEWSEAEELREYVPDYDIRLGIKTDSSQFEGNITGGHSLLRQGYTKWTDMFNERQLLCLAKLLRAIDEMDNQNVKEYLLLAFSNIIRTNSMMMPYDNSRNGIVNLFKSNSFDPPQRPCEGNLWGAKYGRGTFQSIWEMIERGVKYAQGPTDRYIQDDETLETNSFGTSIGENTTVQRGDARTIDAENEYDAIITDPPYYNNIIYSELSDYFYVWQKLLLEDEYDSFDTDHTPRAESIVSNPAEDKGVEEFEDELKQAFSAIERALKDDGTLAFTYHHSDSESWGELLEALCEVGFEVAAAYPISADIQKFTKGEAVSFDIIVVARPATERTPTSWDSLKRDIYNTAKDTHKQLDENRDLSRGDVGVIEMGECFREYSKHHGKVHRGSDVMSAKEVVGEIYGIIQEASDTGVIEVFIDLLDEDDPSYDDVNKHCKTANTTPEELKDMKLYNTDDGFALGTWDNEKRQAYIQERANGESGSDGLTALDKIQFMRYRYEKGKSIQNYADKWGVDNELRKLAGDMADATGDETYERVFGDGDLTNY
jgi:putative DNA methylase